MVGSRAQRRCAMAETLQMISERVDDIPVLLAQLERMGVQPLLDEHFPTHGHGVGLSLGWVTVIWLTHIWSEANHRLNHVEPWAEQRLQTLRGCTGQPVQPLEVSDDRLAAVLEALSDDARWSAFEGVLNQHPRRVYDLGAACVRLDSTTANGHWTVTEDGRFQFGHSKDHRPDRPQVKIMVSALDPLGMPVATDVVPGQRADDPVSIPAITRVRESLGRRGLLYVGDGKMGALEPRAFLQAGGDYDVCPLSESQLPPAILADYLAPVWTGAQAVTVIHRPQPGGSLELIAEGFERQEPVTAEVAGQLYHWLERRLVSRSVQLAHAGERGLQARLAKAQAEVTALKKRRRGRRRYPDPSALREAVDTILTRYRVHGLLHVWYKEQCWERPRRRYGGRDATVRLEWDDHATGLIRLLSLGLRMLTLLEFEVRRRLAMAKTTLSGLSVGNPKRATARPTAERLLEAFQGLTLTIIREGRRRRRHLTQLSRIQQHVLALLAFPVDIYMRLCPDSHKPP